MSRVLRPSSICDYKWNCHGTHTEPDMTKSYSREGRRRYGHLDSTWNTPYKAVRRVAKRSDTMRCEELRSDVMRWIRDKRKRRDGIRNGTRRGEVIQMSSTCHESLPFFFFRPILVILSQRSILMMET
jgi:hypothetical protein